MNECKVNTSLSGFKAESQNLMLLLMHCVLIERVLTLPDSLLSLVLRMFPSFLSLVLFAILMCRVGWVGLLERVLTFDLPV